MFDPTQTYLSSFINPYYRHSWTYAEVYDIVKKPHRFLFGFGSTSPWHIDAWSDPVHSFYTNQVQLFGYVKATPTPVILIADPEDVEHPSELIKVGGRYYLPIEADLDVIEDSECSLVMFRGQLEHDKIKATTAPSSYRSLGLYKDVEYTTDNEEFLLELFKESSQPFIGKKQAVGKLFYMRHLERPSFITPRMIEEIIEIVPFTRN